MCVKNSAYVSSQITVLEKKLMKLGWISIQNQDKHSFFFLVPIEGISCQANEVIAPQLYPVDVVIMCKSALPEEINISCKKMSTLLW